MHARGNAQIHVHTRCLRAHANAPAISGSLAGDSYLSSFLRFASCSNPNRKQTQRRPQRDHFWARIGSPPTSGGQTDDVCTSLTHIKMHAFAHAYAHVHMHIYIYIYTYFHPHQHTAAHTHAHSQKLPARIRKRSSFFDANPGKDALPHQKTAAEARQAASSMSHGNFKMV